MIGSGYGRGQFAESSGMPLPVRGDICKAAQAMEDCRIMRILAMCMQYMARTAFMRTTVAEL
jgi:hypothetical protein